MNDYIQEFLSYIGHRLIAVIGITIAGMIKLYKMIFPSPPGH
jgi:hypothetical protein